MSTGAIRQFLRVKPFDLNKPSGIVVDVYHIIAYKRHGGDNNMTEIILSNGHSVISNEPVEEFEQRFTKLLPMYHID